MTRIGAHADDSGRLSAERNWTFWLRLLATTLAVTVTAYVLSVAFLNPRAKAPRTQRAAAITSIKVRTTEPVR